MQVGDLVLLHVSASNLPAIVLHDLRDLIWGCRIRRVKCGEEKPACERCLKFGVKCDGYETTQKFKKEVALIVPGRKIAIKEETTPPSLVLQPDLIWHLLVDAEDSQYFRYFRDETTLELAGGYHEEPLWNRMILQSCHEAPCIQKMALSIAGLTRAMRASNITDLKTTNDPHIEYALQQYSKALHHFRVYALSDGSPDPRMLLMAGLLIYTFECLQGNIENGIQQVQSMITAFKSMRALKQINHRHLPSAHLAGNFEDELVSEFARLDGQLLGRVPDPDLGNTTVLGILHGHLFDPYVIPDHFPNIRTARRFLEHIQHRGRPNIVYDSKGQKVTMSFEGPEISQPEITIRMLKGSLAQWWKAFKPLFDLSCTPAGDYNFVAAVTMRILALGASLVLQTNCNLDSRQITAIAADAELLTKTGPDVFYSMSREMLDLAWNLVAHRRFVKGFVFDTGTMPYLFLVLVIGYKREFMVEVVELFKAMSPRREGYWASQDLVKTGEMMIVKWDESGW